MRRESFSAGAEKPIVLVDMDGTLANVGHRLHHIRDGGKKNWKAFFRAMDRDEPNPEVLTMVRDLAKNHDIIIATGRPEEYRQNTIAWLERFDVPYNAIYMRRNGDHRPDYIVKREILDELGVGRDRIALVIDDCPSVCDMWRQSGLKCHQIETGEEY